MKKPDTVLREYANRISDDDLKFLHTRLSQRLAGDMAEALQFLGKDPAVDRLLRDQQDGEKLYDIIDVLQNYLDQQFKKRFAGMIV